jgi:hypothetical protein
MNLNGFAVSEVELQLDDRKVFKQFRDRLTSGYPLPFKVPRHAGMKWIGFGEQAKLLPNPTNVNLMLTGRRLRPGVWLMSIPQEVQQTVTFWLLDKCAFPTERPTYKGKKHPKRQRQRIAEGSHFREKVDR